MNKKQYIDDDDGLVLNHIYKYQYFEMNINQFTPLNVFRKMVGEMNKSLGHFLFKKKDYKIRLSLEIIPRGIKVKEWVSKVSAALIAESFLTGLYQQDN